MVRSNGWAGAFVAAMVEERAGGADFEVAFARARTRCGIEPTVLGGFPRSFADDPEAWWKGVCWDAWFNAPAPDGGRSRLHLLPGLVSALGVRDESSSARKAAA